MPGISIAYTPCMSIFSEIKTDHRDLKKMISSLLKTTSHQTSIRKRGFNLLRDLIDAHTRAEETVLYRSLLQSAGARSQILESFEEHHLVDILLGEMSLLSVSDEKWTAKLEVLRASLFKHIKEEENVLFKRARQFIANEHVFREMGTYFRSLVGERLSATSQIVLPPSREEQLLSHESLPR